MRRRDFISLVSGSAVAWPLAARGQNKRGPVIGFIDPGLAQVNGPFLASFLEGMRELGWRDGENMTVLDRWVENQPARLPGIMAGLLAERVDLLATGGSLVTKAARAATDSLPIVMVGVGDPVGFGLAQSLARPGGNVTGLSNMSLDLVAKRLQLLVEMAPAIRRIAVLADSRDPGTPTYWLQTRDNATRIGLTPQLVEVATADDIDSVFIGLSERTDALFVTINPLTVANRTKIATLALANGLPTSCPIRDFVVAGGLQSFGSSLPNDFRRAADFVDRILKGARPADLPIMQPTKFELVINVKTAGAFGLTVPPTMLAIADEVIE
ncbi:MAG: ABC transporter substrate-binding protein [Hyphomicrobiales bacterium]|nr:ABC transporter substrate-binding protein [Hyphomicrobiales bacterium]